MTQRHQTDEQVRAAALAMAMSTLNKAQADLQQGKTKIELTWGERECAAVAAAIEVVLGELR